MSEKLPRKKKESLESSYNPEIEGLIARAPKGLDGKVDQKIQPAEAQKRIVSRGNDTYQKGELRSIEQQRPLSESPNEEELQKLLDTTAHERPNLKEFKDILNKANANAKGAISYHWLEQIGIVAAKRLGGNEYNAFKKYVNDTYELNSADVKDITPGLSFLRDALNKTPLEPKQVSRGEVITTAPNVQEYQAPRNLPGSSPEELEIFQRDLPASVEDWRKERKSIDVSEPLQKIESGVRDSSVVDAEWRSVSESEERIEHEQKKEVSKSDAGTSMPSNERVPEGSSFTDAQKEYLENLNVDMPVDELENMTEPTTRKEWVDELRKVIFGEKKNEGNKGRGERLKEHLAKRSDELEGAATEHGPTAVKLIGSIIEQYNNLNWKTKLVVTGGLMLGASFTAATLPILSGVFGAALYGQRVLGGIGFAMNRRKALDADPNHWLAGKSELIKNTYATVLAAVYMGATSFVVHEGVEGLKAVANSEWLGTMLGHHSISPSSETLETIAPTPDIPAAETVPEISTAEAAPEIVEGEGHFEPYNTYDPRFDQGIAEARAEVDEGIANAKAAVERMQKIVEEQKNILNAMPDGSPVLGDSIPQPETLITPDQGLMSGSADTSPSTDVVPTIEKSPETPFAPPEEVAKFGLDPIDGHPMSELEAQKLDSLRRAMHDPRATGAWPPGPPEGRSFTEKISDWFASNQETIDQFNIDSVSPIEPHIYADSGEHLFAYGGSPLEKMDTIFKFLSDNPGKIVYSTDDHGAYRIPLHLVEGKVVPGDPMRTSGFFGFGSSFMDAPKPEEFAKLIK